MTQTTQTTRYHVTTLDDGRVLLSYPPDSGQPIRIFWAPEGGGYVHDVTRIEGHLGPQVCDGLAISGSTLRVASRADLAGTIRAHARRQAKQEAGR